MASILRAVVASLLLLSGADLGRAAGLGESINRWVGQLGDDNFGVREEASRKLWAAGRAAEPALRAALKGKDPEAVRRARDILDKLEMGIAPDTPQGIIDLARQCHAGDRQAQQEAVERLFEKGAKGYAVLLKLALKEEPRHGRQELFETVITRSQSAVARLLVEEGRPDEAEELLRACVASETDQAVKRDPLPFAGRGPFEVAMQNYAAFLMLRGRLDNKIAEFRSLAEQSWGAGAAELLVYLYQAKSDRPGARWAAERAGNPSLLTLVLEEQGDWEALARQPVPKGGSREVRELSRAAAYHRLAGDRRAFEDALAEIRKHAEAGQLGTVAPLFFLGQPGEALALLQKSKRIAFLSSGGEQLNTTFAFLRAQRRFRDAFALAGEVLAKTKDGDSFDQDVVSWALTHYRLGEKEKAIELLTQVGDRLVKAEYPGEYSCLVVAEYQLGLKDQAFQHLAHILAKKGEGDIDLLLEEVDLFRAGSDAAVVGWGILRRKSPKEPPEITLRKLEDLLEGKTTGENFAALLKEAELAATQVEDEGRRARWLGGVAQICRAAGRGDLAQQYGKKAAAQSRSAEPLVCLGDLLADQKRWQEAAAAYGQAWEKDRQQALPLYLRGWALTQASQEKEGRELMERAHWLPLGNAEARYKLARKLSRRGLAEAARRERELAFRLGWSERDLPLVLGFLGESDPWPMDYALSLDMEDARPPQELRRIAARCERVLLDSVRESNCLSRTASFYLSGPHRVHFLRARAFVAEGRVKEALEEVQLCLAFLPGDIEMPVCLVPELEKRGRKREADELFGRVFGFYEQLCKDYPRWAEGHNSLAWLAARCGRRLDEALAHSLRAVQLEPRSAAYLATLAEVHFQRGDRARALELIKQCVERDPRNEAFRKRLQRFEAGGPAGTPPE